MDKKAWTPDSISTWLPQSARPDVKIKGEKKPGQLYKDLIAAHGNTKIRWSFDARAGTAFSKDDLLNMVETSIDKNFESIAKHLKIEVPTDAAEKSKVFKQVREKIFENFDVEIGGV